MNSGKTGIIVQARMGSSRLPGKVLLTVAGKPLLAHLLDRLAQCRKTDQVIVATSDKPGDDPIAQFCQSRDMAVFRGSENDVLSRYYEAAKRFDLQTIVRITGDCPLIDPDVVDQIIAFFYDKKLDYASNTIERTYPRGLDCEVFSFTALEKTFGEASANAEREHVTLYIYRHPELFSLGHVRNKTDESGHRWTVDTTEDFELIKKLLESLDSRKARLSEYLMLMKKHPGWAKINSTVEQKRI